MGLLAMGAPAAHSPHVLMPGCSRNWKLQSLHQVCPALCTRTDHHTRGPMDWGDCPSVPIPPAPNREQEHAARKKRFLTSSWWAFSDAFDALSFSLF